MSKTVYSFIAIACLIFGGFLFFNNVPHVRASTLYYNAAVNTNWNNAGNWWADAGFTVPGSVPGVADDAIIEGNITSNSGAPASVNTLTVNNGFFILINTTVAAGAVFNDSSVNAGTITGNATFNDLSYNADTVSGNATFNDSSYNQGTVSGDAVFNYASGGTITLTGTQVWGTVSGTVKGSDAVLITTFIFNDSSSVNPGGTVPDGATFNNSSYNGGTISGDATFNDTSYNQGTVSGDVVFNYASGGTITLTGAQVWGNVGGTVKGNDAVLITEFIFNDTSFNNANIPGNATFNNSSYNDSAVSGDAVFNDSSFTDIGSTVTGDAVFNGSSDNNGTISGNAIFNDTSINGGTVSQDATFNDASANYVSVLGNATFNDDATGNFGTVSGNATFNKASYNSGTVSGTATFNDTSFNNVGTVVTGIFNDSSSNSVFATVSGNASFYDSSVNSGNVIGNACFATTADQDGGTVGGTVTACSVFLPAVTTNPATILSSSSADLIGEITDTGGETISEVGFQYGRTTAYGTTVSQTGAFVRETFNNVINSLSCGYHFRAFAINSAGTVYGSDLLFSVSGCGGGIVFPTVSLSANPETIQTGQSSTLSWSSTNANSCSASWINTNETSGSQTIAPASTNTYDITCTSSTGQTVNASITVNVNYVNQTCQDPDANNYGGALPCTYNTQTCQDTSANNYGGSLPCTHNAQTCQDTSANNYGGALPCRYDPQICQNVNAINYGDPLPCVYPRINPTVSISANPTTVNYNGSSTITWTSVNATSCEGVGGSADWAGAKNTSGTFDTGALTSSITYYISCTDRSGTTRSDASATVIVEPAPMLCQDENAINYGETLPCKYSTKIQDYAPGVTRDFLNKPTVKLVSGVATLIPVATSFLLVATALLSGLPIVNYLFYLFVVFSQILGLKKKPKPWGTVYDSYTKRPLPFARVEILNEQSRKLDATITDQNGRYGFLIGENVSNIQLRAYLAKYDFPTKNEPSVVEQKLYPNIYKGGLVTSTGGTNLDIPMDSRDKAEIRNFYFGISSVKLNNILSSLANVLFVVGTTFGFANAIVNPSAFSYSVLALVFLTFFVRTSGFKLKPFGLTKDTQTNQTLPFGLITLHNQNGERTNFTVSDDKGRYFLLTPKGDYTLKAYTPSHISPARTKEMSISTRKGWISREIGV